MLPNLTLLQSDCTVGDSWDALPYEIKLRVISMRKCTPMSVITISKNPWLITAQLFEEGAEPPLKGRWELSYDGYERLGNTDPRPRGFSWLDFSIPNRSQAAAHLKRLLFEPDYPKDVKEIRSLIQYKSTFEEWRLNVPLAPNDTKLMTMATLIGTSAPEAFDRLFRDVRSLYVGYEPPSYQRHSGDSPEDLRKLILKNLDNFAEMVSAVAATPDKGFPS